MQELILATDVAEHVKVIMDIEKMVEGMCEFILNVERVFVIQSAGWGLRKLTTDLCVEFVVFW